MRTALAEKHSAAADMARVLGANENKGDWFEGNGWYVTWCRGHLLQMTATEAEGKWSQENLPIIPEHFYLVPLDREKDSSGKAVGTQEYKSRINVIRRLFLNSDEIVCCTDAEREGQLIFDNVYRYLGIQKPVRRLWISSLTEKAIAEGFSNLMDNRLFAPLARAARMRTEADWLVGINATRALTCRTGSAQVLSIGRVQTPTLGMICERYEENKSFVKQPYWFISGKAVKDMMIFSWRGETRFFDRAEGEAVKNRIVMGAFLTVEEVSKETRTEQAPLLYDITAIQKEADARYEFPADKTLDIVQTLYEKKLVSYPRTNSRHIPEDVFATVPELIRALYDDAEYGAAARTLDLQHLNRNSVSDTKITDHHGLVITGYRPENLSEDQRKIYDLILVRFLEAFSEPCVAEVTKVRMKAAGEPIIARGRRELRQGWRAIARGDSLDFGCGDDPEAVEDDPGADIIGEPLPEMRQGEQVRSTAVSLEQTETKPKALLTTASLLTMMDNAGRLVEDREMAKAIRSRGLGTGATRAGIIAELLTRGYVVREKRKLIPTDTGLALYHALKGKEISSVTLTAAWETRLGDVAEGLDDGKGFREQIRKYTREITSEILSMQGLEELVRLTHPKTYKCPKCGGAAKLTPSGLFCENESCGLKIWRTAFGKKLTDDQITTLAYKRRTNKISGFVSQKTGKKYDAALILDEGWTVRFDTSGWEKPAEAQNGASTADAGVPRGFSNAGSFKAPGMARNEHLASSPTGEYGQGRSVSDEVILCPKCGERMRINGGGAFCDCGVKLYRTKCGKTLTDRQLAILAKDGRTPVLKGFVGKTGKAFSAALVIDTKNGYAVNMEFEKSYSK